MRAEAGKSQQRGVNAVNGVNGVKAVNSMGQRRRHIKLLLAAVLRLRSGHAQRSLNLSAASRSTLKPARLEQMQHARVPPVRTLRAVS